MTEKRLIHIEDDECVLDCHNSRTITSSRQGDRLFTESVESDGIGSGLDGNHDNISPASSRKSLPANSYKTIYMKNGDLGWEDGAKEENKRVPCQRQQEIEDENKVLGLGEEGAYNGNKYDDNAVEGDCNVDDRATDDNPFCEGDGHIDSNHDNIADPSRCDTDNGLTGIYDKWNDVAEIIDGSGDVGGICGDVSDVRQDNEDADDRCRDSRYICLMLAMITILGMELR